jgi:hypothetical protein
MHQENRSKLLQCAATPSLVAAVKLGADRELMTISEFVRRSLIDRLRGAGIDPMASRPIDRRTIQETGTAA